MKQTKRFLALLLSTALCLSLAACASSAGNTSSATNTDNTAVGDTAADNTASMTEDSTAPSSADSTLSAVLYQSASTLEVSAEGSFIEDFLLAAAAGENCQLYFSLEAQGDALFIFNAFPDGEYVAAYCHDFATDEGDAVDSVYGGDMFACSYEGYTGDFSQLTNLFIYMIEDDEFILGGAFEIASVMQSDSIFSGGESADADDGQPDEGAEQSEVDDAAQDFFEAFEGSYYVYNNLNYTLPLTITMDATGADMLFSHNDYSCQTRFEAADFVSTIYGDDCIVFAQGEDNMIASFVLNGATAYVSIYINYSDGDTGAKAVYDYKIEDQVAAVDDAFIREYMGEYFDIESGQDLCNLGLYNGGYLGYKDVNGVSYTVDTILGAELVNGNQVNVTLTASDGSTFDASISFGHNGSALRASVNGGWIMEAAE